MGNIRSSLGNTNFEGGARTFTVNDSSDQEFVPVTPDEAAALRQRMIYNSQEQQRSSDSSAKKRLEILLGIGRAVREVPLESFNGHVVFTIRTLKGREQRYIANLAESSDKNKPITELFGIRDQTLAYSVISIDGINIDDVLNITDLNDKDKNAAKLAFVSELDDSISGQLYKEFQQLVVENRIDLKTDTAVKEVAEQIKKSDQGS